MEKNFRSYGADTANANPAWTTITISGNASDIGSEDIPTSFKRGHLSLQASGVGVATEIQWYLSEDVAGEYALTPKVTWTLADTEGATGGTYVNAYDLSNIPYIMSSFGVSGDIYLQALEDADTPDLVIILRGIREG